MMDLGGAMRGRFVRATMLGLLACLSGATAGEVAKATPRPIDCPLRNAPFSIDTPMVDLLTKPEAVALIEQIRPDILRTLTRRMRETTAPTFGAIITPRAFATLKGEEIARLQPSDAALRRIVVTPADADLRRERYDVVAPRIALPPGRPRVLLFEKMTGFRDGPSVETAATAIETIAREQGWALVRSDRAGVMTPGLLRRFDAVIWNNVSGDVLTIQ